jgi:hypothetical protein
LVTLSFICLSKAYCPNADDLYPCKCEELSERLPRITCLTNETLNLKSIFSKVNEDMSAVEQAYDIIDIENNKLEEIPENVFGKLNFVSIRLREGCSSLRKIHPNAFLHQYNTTRGLYVEAENVISSSPNSFYNLANSFNKLQSLLYYSHIGTLEEKFSEKLNNNLESTGFRLDSIKGSPFSKMINNNYITIKGENFDRIQSKALKIGGGSDEGRFIKILLADTRLNSSSFEKGCFTNFPSKASITLLFPYLSSTLISYLDEAIFLPFLLQPNHNLRWSYTNAATSTLDCDDCRSAWICKSSTSDQVRENISRVRCRDERNLIDCKKNFLKCK